MYFGLFVLGICCVSALAVPNTATYKFKYVNSLYRRSDQCNICFGDDCLPFDQARCDFYAAADSILPKDDEPEGFWDPQLQSDVDSVMFDIAEKVTQSPEYECIPYISKYTDCTKDNVCLGCKTCYCGEDGKWNCTTSICNIPDPTIDVDHRILIMTMENLAAKNTKMNRDKRSVTIIPFENVNSSTLSLEQLTEWIYGVTPNDRPNTPMANNEDLAILDNNMDTFSIEQQNVDQTNNDVTVRSEFTTAEVISTTTEPVITTQPFVTSTSTIPIATVAVTTDTDYLAFDEVLNNIATDTKNYTRRKPLLDVLPTYSTVISSNKTSEFDYMLLDDDQPSGLVREEKMSDNAYMVNFEDQNDGTEGTLDDATKVVIDLLESAKRAQTSNYTDYGDLTPNKEDLVGVGFDNTNDIFEYNSMNVMKREVPSSTVLPNTNNVNKTNIYVRTINNTENQTVPAKIETKNNLKNNVLLPLIKLINSKRNELDDLKKIKENLIGFMNYYNESPIVEIIDYPNISDSNILHDVEMFPDLGIDLRRTNPHVMQKFLYKLKADIYEVIKDIIGLERYREGRLPDDLSILIHSLKRYALKHKTHKRHQKSVDTKPSSLFLRRSMASSNNKCLESTLKQCMIELLEAVDKDMPQSNALASLSPVTRRILRRLIHIYNNDVYSSIGNKVHDPNYNMTTDLIDIGSGWQDIANNAIGKSPHETMYKMKYLHYLMQRDITKINDALSVIDFAHSRRMTPFFRSVGNDVIEHIKNGLNSVHNNVQVIVKYHANGPNTIAKKLHDVIKSRIYSDEEAMPETTTEFSGKHKHKKLSFIKQIRNLLKSSKKDVSELIHRKVPKSEIVKQLAKQKLNELAQKRYDDYEKVMKKWQKNLGVLPMRYKRNAPEGHSNRLTNILPKYLRGKVHKKNTGKSKNKVKKDSTHISNKQNKKTILSTVTTPHEKTTKNAKMTKKPVKSAAASKRTARSKHNRSLKKH